MTQPSLGVRRAMLILSIDAVTAECSSAFHAAGVPHLLLKGPTIARWLYRDGVPRYYSDSDLLVPGHRLEHACDVLEALGFRDLYAGWRADERTRHAKNYVRDGRSVDLHHTLALVPDGAPVWDVLTRDTERFHVAGVDVPAPGPAARCVFLALHAAQHGQEELKPLEDLARGLAQVPDQVWEHAEELAEELSCGPAFRLGRALVERPDLPASDPVRLGAPLDVRLRAFNAAPGARSLAQLMQLRGRARLARALRRAVPSRAWMRNQYGPSGRGGLALSYAAHLRLFARRLAPAVRVLQQTRRDSRR